MAEHTIFTSAYGIVTKTDHILDHKMRLNKLKKTEILQSMFSDYNGIILEISNNKVSIKTSVLGNGNKTLLSNR